MLHIVLHFLVPAIVAWYGFRKKRINAWLMMSAAMLVDLDLLLANPIFDPNRCSIGFHPLHSWLAIGSYGFMQFFPKLRIIGIGLLIHMALDYLDWSLTLS